MAEEDLWLSLTEVAAAKAVAKANVMAARDRAAARVAATRAEKIVRKLADRLTAALAEAQRPWWRRWLTLSALLFIIPSVTNAASEEPIWTTFKSLICNGKTSMICVFENGKTNCVEESNKAKIFRIEFDKMTVSGISDGMQKVVVGTSIKGEWSMTNKDNNYLFLDDGGTITLSKESDFLGGIFILAVYSEANIFAQGEQKPSIVLFKTSIFSCYNDD